MGRDNRAIDLCIDTVMDEKMEIVRAHRETVRAHREIVRTHREIVRAHREIVRAHTEIERYHFFYATDRREWNGF